MSPPSPFRDCETRSPSSDWIDAVVDVDAGTPVAPEAVEPVDPIVSGSVDTDGGRAGEDEGYRDPEFAVLQRLSPGWRDYADRWDT